MKVDLPLGDVVDRATILHIKEQRIAAPEALAHVREELRVLEDAWTAEGLRPMASLAQWAALIEVNTRLWEVEDDLRLCERASRFDSHFVELARQVYRLNDRRATLKRALSEALGSALVEEKSYADWGA